MSEETKVSTATTVDDEIEWLVPSKEECNESTSLVDYLMLSPSMLKLESLFEKINGSNGIMCTNTSVTQLKNFMAENPILSNDLHVIISLLQKVSGQRGYLDKEDVGKLTFEFVGVFRGTRFNLYDYKEDESIHIGGPDSCKSSSWSFDLKTVIAHQLQMVQDKKASYVC